MTLPRLLHRRFDEQADRTPERAALHYGSDSISYGDLREQSDRVGAALRSQGIGAGSLIGLHLERSIPWVGAVLGILKSGAAVVPLPPSYPSDRLRETRTFCGLDAVIEGPDTPFDVDRTATVLGLEQLLSGPPQTDPGRSASGGELSPRIPAFVLSSSGSTGQPKMIVRSHQSFFHRLSWTWSTHPFADGELGCQKAHMTTTHALYELFEPLLAGAPTLIIPDDEARNIARFWEILHSESVTRLLIVPSALRASLDMPDFEAPTALRVMVLMGEYVAPGLAERAVNTFPADTSLYSIYGSTEASSTLLVDLRESTRPGEELPLGVPITPDVSALVLDPELRPVPPGEVGRLHIAGAPLFDGYLNDPEMTSSVIVEDRSSTPTTRLYDTRDQVRRTTDGQLHFVGRVDHTVKVRGYRVDIPEVERAMRQHPDVTQAAVVVTGEGTSSVGLVGFYVPSATAESEVYEAVRRRLPEYMVPSTLIGLDSFPLTPSAKVDRVQLLEDHLSNQAPSGFDRELSETERRLVDAWAAVLGHHRFGLESSFFEVGGTSLTVFALAHRVRESMGFDRDQLREESVYRYPTLQGQAALVDRLQGSAPVTEVEEQTPILVTLRSPAKGFEDRPSLIVVPSAGGTLGAYELLARALPDGRGVVGVRDPYLWGERDLTEGFQAWVRRYVGAIRAHQAPGPYAICAYSSAGAFGYEIARQLQAEGDHVELLVLVDPLGIDRGSRRRFGYWAFQSVWMRNPGRALIRLAGHLRTPLIRVIERLGDRHAPNDFALSPSECQRIAEGIRRSPSALLNLAALFELNTGLPYALQPADFDDVDLDRSLGVFLDHATSITPEVDPESIERIAIQYGAQVKAQHAYILKPLAVETLVVEPATRHAGIVAALLRPYVQDLEARVIEVGEPSGREQMISERFGRLQTHYRSMRNPTFSEGLANVLVEVLGRQ